MHTCIKKTVNKVHFVVDVYRALYDDTYFVF